MAEQAHHPEVKITGMQQENLSVHGIPELGHLDETPYEHDHVDYESRFLERSPVPHHEIGHDTHGLQAAPLEVVSHLGDVAHALDQPTYEELLWAY